MTQIDAWIGTGTLALLIAVAVLMAFPVLAVMAWRLLTDPYLRTPRRFQFDDDSPATHHILGEIENGPDANNRSIEQLARFIKARHSAYGEVELTESDFDSFIKNFNNDVYGQKLFVDLAHNPNAGAAMEFVRVFKRGDQLLAEMKWNPMGVKAFNDDGFRYFSLDFSDDYVNNETGEHHGPTLFGAGFVTRPFIKGMAASEGPGRMYFSENGPAVPGYLGITKTGDTMNWRTKLKDYLKSLGLSEGVINQMLSGFDAQTKQFGEDEAALKAAYNVWAEAGKGLADEIGNKDVKLTIDTPAAANGGGAQLSEEQVGQLLDRRLAEREQKAATDKAAADKKLGEVRAAFDEHLDAATGLSEDVRDQLKKDWHDALTADTPAAQIKTFADLAIKSGNQQAASAKLQQLGYDVGGQGQHVQINDSPPGQRLGEEMRAQLGNSNQGHMLKLTEHDKLNPFARRVLAEFDRVHGARIHAERKLLAGEDGVNIADGEFPIAAQRQVIIEALSDLAILDVIATNVDPQATATTQIPYEQRITNSVHNEGIVYEGQPIPFAGVRQRMDTAYITPRKIALLMSNEMIHFSRASRIDWDAWARNIASNARLMRELVTRAIANTMLRSADSYMSATVTDENVTASFNGNGEFTLANFPVVRPHQQRDLQGEPVGTAENAFTVTDGGTAVPPWDGTGKQDAGTYWRITSVNMGKGQFVDASGAPASPGGTVLVSYTYSTNLVKVDLDTPEGVKRADHLNEILYAIGRRKANLADDRLVTPNMALMSHTLNQTCTEAEAFTAAGNRPGVTAGASGNLEAVKGIPGWATNEPGIDLGDERILIGERGSLNYTIAKPFQTGTPFEAVDPATSQPTGQKVAYGEEYSAVHVPKPIRDRFTSVLVYSASSR